MTASEILMVVFTAVIAGTGVIGAFIFGGQLNVMQGQLNEMKSAGAYTKTAADAAKLSAEALIDAERARLYAVIIASNLEESLQAAVMWPNSPTMDDGYVSYRPAVEFRLKNMGRTPAILKEASYQLIQGTEGQTVFEYGLKVIANPAVDSGTLTDPLSCQLETLFSVGDSRRALDGSRPLYLYGHVIFATSFGRDYVYFWRYENSGVRWVLAHYEEHPKNA